MATFMTSLFQAFIHNILVIITAVCTTIGAIVGVLMLFDKRRTWRQKRLDEFIAKYLQELEVARGGGGGKYHAQIKNQNNNNAALCYTDKTYVFSCCLPKKFIKNKKELNLVLKEIIQRDREHDNPLQFSHQSEWIKEGFPKIHPENISPNDQFSFFVSPGRWASSQYIFRQQIIKNIPLFEENSARARVRSQMTRKVWEKITFHSYRCRLQNIFKCARSRLFP